MRTIKIYDFLDGQTIITLDKKSGKTFGEHVFYDGMDLVKLTAETKCHESDSFNEDAGIDIIKMKLSRKYHKYNRCKLRKELRVLDKRVKRLEEQCAKATRKIDNISTELSRL